MLVCALVLFAGHHVTATANPLIDDDYVRLLAADLFEEDAARITTNRPASVPPVFRVERDGTARFTIAAVAAEAGVSKPSVYYYFSNRDEVLWELARAWSVRCAQEARARLEGLRGPDAAEALVRVWVELHLSLIHI